MMIKKKNTRGKPPLEHQFLLYTYSLNITQHLAINVCNNDNAKIKMLNRPEAGYFTCFCHDNSGRTARGGPVSAHSSGPTERTPERHLHKLQGLPPLPAQRTVYLRQCTFGHEELHLNCYVLSKTNTIDKVNRKRA